MGGGRGGCGGGWGEGRTIPKTSFIAPFDLIDRMKYKNRDDCPLSGNSGTNHARG